MPRAKHGVSQTSYLVGIVVYAEGSNDKQVVRNLLKSAPKRISNQSVLGSVVLLKARARPAVPNVLEMIYYLNPSVF